MHILISNLAERGEQKTSPPPLLGVRWGTVLRPMRKSEFEKKPIFKFRFLKNIPNVQNPRFENQQFFF